MPSDRRSVAIDDIAFLANSKAHLTVLQALGTSQRTRQDPAAVTGSRQELAAVTEISPARVNRVLEDLEARDWIVAVNDTYRLTPLGTRIGEGFGAMLEMLSVERRLRPVLPWVPTEEATFDIKCLRDAEVVRPTESDPERPLHRTAALLGAGDRLHVVADHVLPAFLDGIWRAVVQSGGALEAVITTGVADAIGADPERAAQFRDVLEASETTVFVSNEVALYVIVVDDVVGIICPDAEHTLRAVILCADECVQQWASAIVRTYRDGAEPLTPDGFTG